MIDEKAHRADSFSFSAELEDWEKLVKLVDKKAIVDLVKHDKHMLQQEFRGFRPDHLPWKRVPRVIAQHAQICNSTRTFLLRSWLAANKDLCISVKEAVSVSTIEDDVAKLLAANGCTEKSRDCLLWALILDGREEINTALTEGLREALSQTSSSLSLKAEIYMLRFKLEEAQQNSKSAQSERDTLKAQVAQIPHMKMTIQALEQKIDQKERQHTSKLAGHTSELAGWSVALQSAKEERENILKELEQTRQGKSELQTQLEEEHLQHDKLQNELNTLKNSLDVKLASQLEKTDAVQRQLDETLDLLEEERNLNKLYAYDIHVELPLLELKQAWNAAAEDIARHISLAPSDMKASQISISADDRWADWLHWQQQEETLVHPLLSSVSMIAGVEENQDLNRVASAQKLLMLRWYLLEWFRLTILETLRADSRARVVYMEDAK